MEVIKLHPQGYCKGVIEAINIIKKNINDCPKPFYILGNIIHNMHVVNAFNELGAITLEGNSRLELLDKIDSGTVVFTAHGVSDKVRNKAKEKGLYIIDATCNMVNDVKNMILKKINTHTIIYIGKKNHPETEGILGLSDDIILYDDINNPPIINKNVNYFVANQTTLSIFEIERFYEKIKHDNVLFMNVICNATTIRQNAVMNQMDVDLCIIVGDKNSSNTNKLYEVSVNERKIKAIKIESVFDLNFDDLKNIKKVSVTSGASTPSKITNQVIDFLKQFDYDDIKTHILPNKIDDIKLL